MKITKLKPQVVVKYLQGLTLSKNFQSFRVDAGIELPCDVADTKETFAKARKLVEEQLEIAITENKSIVGDLAKL